MDASQPSTSALFNPSTRAAHRRDVVRQITLPLILGGLVFLAVIVGLLITAIGGAQESSGEFWTSRWADVSLLWLLCPQLLLSLICLGSVGGMVYGMAKFIAVLPSLAYKVQNFFWRVQTLAARFSNGAVEPVLKLRSAVAGLRQLKESLAALFSKK